MFCIAPPKHKSMLIVCAVREEKVPIEGQGTCGMFYDTCLFFSPVSFNFKVSVESCCLLLVQFRDSGCGYIPSFLSNTREDDADCFAYFPGELEGFKPVKYTHMLEMEPKYLVPSANSLAGVLVCFGAPLMEPWIETPTRLVRKRALYATNGKDAEFTSRNFLEDASLNHWLPAFLYILCKWHQRR